ncbi:MAG: threonine dehydratase [Chloroflexota bacterium]|nr:threonine dehydratase [Chloroflexota bacterium]
MIETPDPLSLESIRRARGRIDPAFLDTPQYVHEGLSARAGIPVIVKIETANPIRSFKGRGTWIALHALSEQGRVGPDRAVVVASAGNFGQGVAYAARALHVEAVVFASRNANRAKIARMRALGATVIEAGEDFDDARAGSETYAVAEDAELLVDGHDPWIATGAATMGLEIADAVRAGVLPPPVVALVPVGNGSLINGVASGLHGTVSGCRIVGVQAAGASAMTLSWRAGRAIDTPSVATYADGIASRVSIPAAVALMAGRVNDMVLVSDEALRAAQAVLTEELGITVEGAAAAAWAGLEAIQRPDGAALLIITGSNT